MKLMSTEVIIAIPAVIGPPDYLNYTIGARIAEAPSLATRSL